MSRRIVSSPVSYYPQQQHHRPGNPQWNQQQQQQQRQWSASFFGDAFDESKSAVSKTTSETGIVQTKSTTSEDPNVLSMRSSTWNPAPSPMDISDLSTDPELWNPEEGDAALQFLPALPDKTNPSAAALPGMSWDEEEDHDFPPELRNSVSFPSLSEEKKDNWEPMPNTFNTTRSSAASNNSTTMALRARQYKQLRKQQLTANSVKDATNPASTTWNYSRPKSPVRPKSPIRPKSPVRPKSPIRPKSPLATLLSLRPKSPSRPKSPLASKTNLGYRPSNDTTNTAHSTASAMPNKNLATPQSFPGPLSQNLDPEKQNPNKEDEDNAVTGRSSRLSFLFGGRSSPIQRPVSPSNSLFSWRSKNAASPARSGTTSSSSAPYVEWPGTQDKRGKTFVLPQSSNEETATSYASSSVPETQPAQQQGNDNNSSMVSWGLLPSSKDNNKPAVSNHAPKPTLGHQINSSRAPEPASFNMSNSTTKTSLTTNPNLTPNTATSSRRQNSLPVVTPTAAKSFDHDTTVAMQEGPALPHAFSFPKSQQQSTQHEKQQLPLRQRRIVGYHRGGEAVESKYGSGDKNHDDNPGARPPNNVGHNLRATPQPDCTVVLSSSSHQWVEPSPDSPVSTAFSKTSSAYFTERDVNPLAFPEFQSTLKGGQPKINTVTPDRGLTFNPYYSPGEVNEPVLRLSSAYLATTTASREEPTPSAEALLLFNTKSTRELPALMDVDSSDTSSKATTANSYVTDVFDGISETVSTARSKVASSSSPSLRNSYALNRTKKTLRFPESIAEEEHVSSPSPRETSNNTSHFQNWVDSDNFEEDNPSKPISIQRRQHHHSNNNGKDELVRNDSDRHNFSTREEKLSSRRDNNKPEYAARRDNNKPEYSMSYYRSSNNLPPKKEEERHNEYTPPLRSVAKGRNPEDQQEEYKVVLLGGGLTAIQSSSLGYARRQTPSDYDDGLSNSEVESDGYTRIPSVVEMLNAGKNENDSSILSGVNFETHDYVVNVGRSHILDEDDIEEEQKSSSTYDPYNGERTNVIQFRGTNRLSRFSVNPLDMKKLLRVYRQLADHIPRHTNLVTFERRDDEKKAFALFEMRSRIMEKDIDRGLERRGGTTVVDDLVLTPYYRAGLRVRDAIIVAKAWRDGANPQDVVNTAILTRRAEKTFFIRRPIFQNQHHSSSSSVVSSFSTLSQSRFYWEAVKWIDDTDFMLFRCPSLGPRTLRGFEMFTIGDCQSMLLKLTNQRCCELRAELNAATKKQLLAEEMMKADDHDAEEFMTESELAYLAAMERVKTISKKLVVAEQAFTLVRDRIEKLIAKYEALLEQIDAKNGSFGDASSVISLEESSVYSDEPEAEKWARRARRAELKAEVAAREALMARQEADWIRQESQMELERIQSKLEELQSESTTVSQQQEQEERIISQLRPQKESIRRSPHPDVTEDKQKIESVKQRFRDRMAAKQQKTEKKNSKPPRPPTKISKEWVRAVGEEMFSHLDFYERSLKSVEGSGKVMN